MITPALCRAARALLDLSQRDLAEASNLGESTVRGYEAGRREPGPNNLAAMQRALESRGVTFLDDDGAAGPGVRARPAP